MYLKRPAGGLAFCLFYLASSFTNKVSAGRGRPGLGRAGRGAGRCGSAGQPIRSCGRGGEESAGSQEQEEEKEDRQCPLLSLLCSGRAGGPALPGRDCPTREKVRGTPARRPSQCAPETAGRAPVALCSVRHIFTFPRQISSAIVLFGRARRLTSCHSNE